MARSQNLHLCRKISSDCTHQLEISDSSRASTPEKICLHQFFNLLQLLAGDLPLKRSLKGIYDLQSKDLPMLRRDFHVWERQHMVRCAYLSRRCAPQLAQSRACAACGRALGYFSGIPGLLRVYPGFTCKLLTHLYLNTLFIFMSTGRREYSYSWIPGVMTTHTQQYKLPKDELSYSL